MRIFLVLFGILIGLEIKILDSSFSTQLHIITVLISSKPASGGNIKQKLTKADYWIRQREIVSTLSRIKNLNKSIRYSNIRI